MKPPGDEIALCLIAATDLRADETSAHVRRIGLYAAALGRVLGWDEARVACIRAAAPLHDIGKLGVPDCILQKSGPLNEGEWVLMKAHTTLGARILQGSRVPYIQMGARIAACHHERWDGGGYPVGLKGEAIPIEARITCLVDIYDALIHRRVYKVPWQESAVLTYLRENSGRHFDPRLVTVFFENYSHFRTLIPLLPHDLSEPGMSRSA